MHQPLGGAASLSSRSTARRLRLAIFLALLPPAFVALHSGIHLTDSQNPIFVDVTREAGLASEMSREARPSNTSSRQWEAGARPRLRSRWEPRYLAGAWVDSGAVSQRRRPGLCLVSRRWQRSLANDLTPNLLYHNVGSGKFEETGILASVAFDENGVEEGSMGADFGDFNNDGWLDLYYTNSSYQTNQLAINNQQSAFALRSYPLGHGDTTWLYVGWGTFWADLDNDGWEDIFVANGHLYADADRFDMGLKYKQRKLLFMNLAGKTFKESAATWGASLNQPDNSRGLAYGDYDNDGDLDVLINNQEAAPVLLRNDGGNRNGWLAVQLVGRKSNRSAVGARDVLRSTGKEQVRETKAGSNYASQNDSRLHFGLGEAKQVDELEIRWPSGKIDKFSKLPANQILVIDEQQGVQKN